MRDSDNTSFYGVHFTKRTSTYDFLAIMIATTFIIPTLGFVQTGGTGTFEHDTYIECDDHNIRYDSFSGMLEATDSTTGVVILSGVARFQQDGSLNVLYRMSGGEQVDLYVTELPEDYFLDYVVTQADGSPMGNANLTISKAEVDDMSYEVIEEPQEAALAIPLLIGSIACSGQQYACYNDVNQAEEDCLNGCYPDPPPGCAECCQDRADDDILGCLASCGLNGPDNDYSNCW